MTCTDSCVYSFSTTFLQKLFTSRNDWSSFKDELPSTKQILNSKFMFVPFVAEGRTSMFVIVGARHISEYDKNTLAGDTPCILYFNPYNDKRSRHDPRIVLNAICCWLNKMWRERRSDSFEMPFTPRTMRLCSPFGTCVRDPQNCDSTISNTTNSFCFSFQGKE